jgi:RNA polymerase sigma-70 factor, ECF subfamily
MAANVQQMVEQHGAMVLRRCRRLLGDEQDALEAMQEVFVRLVAHAPRLDADSGSSLMFRMATNVCMDRIGQRRRRAESFDHEPAEHAGPAPRLDDRVAARALLDQLLGEEHATTGAIAVKHLLERMTLEEVSAEVGLSVSGVRKRLARLRERLRAIEQVA